MKTNNKILIPFIIDDPLVGRVIYPLDKVLWIGFIGILLFFLYSWIVDYFKGQAVTIDLFILSFIFLPFGALIFLITGAIKDFFYDKIIIENNEFQFRSSKIFSKPQMVFPLEQISKLIWLQKTVKQNYQTVKLTNDFILLDKNEISHFLLKDINVGVSDKRWSKFLNAIENQSGLTIEKAEESLNIKKE